MSVQQKEIRKCKHEKCPIKKGAEDYQLCVYYLKDCDGCDY